MPSGAELCKSTYPASVEQQGAPRSPGPTVISSREIGSMDRKSRGRGRRGPIWEVQCKQSQLLIIPAHVRSWMHFDVFPQRPLRPPIPRSQTACAEGRGKGGCSDSSLGRVRARGVAERGRERDEEAFSTFWDTERGDERMWSGAELTGIRPAARPALIIADVS